MQGTKPGGVEFTCSVVRGEYGLLTHPPRHPSQPAGMEVALAALWYTRWDFWEAVTTAWAGLRYNHMYRIPNTQKWPPLSPRCCQASCHKTSPKRLTALCPYCCLPSPSLRVPPPHVEAPVGTKHKLICSVQPSWS